jgi:maltose/moltooligosaccharide transporter
VRPSVLVSHMADRPFPWRKTLILGFGFFGINAISPLFNSLIPPMLEDLGLAATVIGFIMTWDNIINLFTQPWVGSRSDRTHTRFGRRKPWLMLGAPLAAFFFILLPFVRENFVLLALALLGSHLGIALLRSPTMAFLGDMFQPAERSRSNGVIHLVGGLGGVFALLGGGALYRIGVPLPFIVGSGVMLTAIGIVVAFLKEPDLSEQPASEPDPGIWASARRVATDRDRSGLFLLAAIFSWFTGCSPILAFCTLYARNVLGVAAGTSAQMMTAFPAALIVFAIPSGFLATRIGRKPTIIAGLGGMVLCSLVGFTLGNPAVLLAVLAAMGAFWALVTINALPMVYDLTVARGIGAFTGLYYFAASLAATTGPILAGRLIDSTSYRIIWPFCLVFLALAIALMTQVRPRREA